MAIGETDKSAASSPKSGGDVVELESGAYEVLRKRLNSRGQELRDRLDRLNTARKDVFGAIESTLIATERITTEHNCIPSDMVAVGQRLIFGYNVHFGLKTETHLADVFAVYRFAENMFHPEPLELINTERFQRDFQEVYRYYKNASFFRFVSIGPFLYMVIQVGKTPDDFKSFKWAFHSGGLEYVDNRSDHEVVYPTQHEFDWNRTTRDMHRPGRHPHISIEDRVFVETVGGDLTIKVENNTESGEGVYAEPVEHKDQILDDAEIYYAKVGNLILLKIRPYQEEAFRYIVFNEKLKQSRRIDSIENACVLLPDDHGLIFANGYYLQNGEHKTFGDDLGDMRFTRRIAAQNGEDHLYIFLNRRTGMYVLLQYNVIQQRVDTPILCHGSALFRAGELVCFKSHHEPQKHHAVQIWKTPYVAEDFVPQANTDSYLFKIGNRDLVRAMAECHEILGLIDKEEAYADLYVDLVKTATDVIDSYFWIGREETCDLKSVLIEIKDAAAAAVNEYEKVVRVRQNTRDRTRQAQEDTRKLLSTISHARFEQIDEFVQALSQLRGVRGDIISLRDLRYVDVALVEDLEQQVIEQSESVARRCVDFLLQPEALTPYRDRITAAQAKIPQLDKAADAKQLEEEISAGASELEMLLEVVGNLKIDDATQRTAIVDDISAIFANVNRARATLKTRIKELLSTEGVAEFASQMKLLNQAVVNYLDVCETPNACEDYLARTLLQLEDLESRFAEFDEFVVQLAEKREEIHNAFESRKLSLVEARNKRAQSLLSAAERILKGVKSRAESLQSINEINGYFASDLMVEKVRDCIVNLRDLGDSVKVDDLQSRLKTIQQDAVRQLKDRQELYVEGDNIIKMGKHLFTVNTQSLDLTTVLRDDLLWLHLTGTNFFEPLSDEQLLAHRDLWEQELISENREVYRGEFLAWRLLQASRNNEGPSEQELHTSSDQELLDHVRKFMAPRYAEGYVKGVHDDDASKLLKALLTMDISAGMLRHHPRARAMAVTYWRYFGDKREKNLMESRLKGYQTLAEVFPGRLNPQRYIDELSSMLQTFAEEFGLFPADLCQPAAKYLFQELTTGGGFVISRTAADLYEAFQKRLSHSGADQLLSASLKSVQRHPQQRFLFLRQAVAAFLQENGAEMNLGEQNQQAAYIDETAVLLWEHKAPAGAVFDASLVCQIEGMLGSHPTIQKGKYQLDYHQFQHKVSHYEQNTLGRYAQFTRRKRECVLAARKRLRLEEFQPRVLTSFVRNKLIDSVYLPLIGDNLAKQLGAAGDQKRTDLMGLLLLISPPGYGKTTLMEYVANRLGLIFMKINGPAIGRRVTSLDPAEAPNAGAREEVEKLNLALEMGDNVMIYVDDIQHCDSEFLQKFISLCDAQRKIEGVYQGHTRTYDLRGRKVAVVMAGNPYTESGEAFEIPDMLANRADIYNLGEIIGDSAEAFEMSYLENSLTSNPTLRNLGARSQNDVYGVIHMAMRDDPTGIDLEGSYSPEELGEMTSVMKKLLRVRDVVLQVNRQYIKSAAQADEYRTEPPFKLQGSYRNMNRIAEKVVAVMNDQELQTLIVSSYESDAQTLTSDAEANLLKFREMLEILTDSQRERWEEIKKVFRKNVQLKGLGEDDKFSQVLLHLGSFSEGLSGIQQVMSESAGQLAEKNGGLTEESLARLIGPFQEVLQKAMQQAGETGNGRGPVPNALMEVVQSQFRLMQSYLEPILRTSQAQGDDLQRLGAELRSCLSDYESLLTRIEKVAQPLVAQSADVGSADGALPARGEGKTPK